MAFPWRRMAAVALLAVLLAVALVAATPQGRTGVKAALFVPQVVPAIPIKPQRWLTRTPIQERVEFPLPGGQGIADIYRPPGKGPHPAILLFLGVAPAGPEDPRVVNLGEALARAGTAAMFYWSPVMMEKRINPADVDNLVAAFTYLQGLPFVDSKRVGMGGFCVGASFALMAASRAEIRDSVTFVNAFGPYFRMRDLGRAIASGTRFDGGSTQPWAVDSLSREVFQLQLIEALDDPQERERLRRAFSNGGDGQSLDVERLSAQGRAVYRLLRGVSFEEAEGVMQELPSALLEQMERVSPWSYLDGLRARVLVMHDRQDNLVPSEESRRLVRALEERGNVYYTEFSFFQHMDPTRRVPPLTFVREAGRLFLHMYALLRVAT